MREGGRRPRQMSRYGRDHLGVAWNASEFRTGGLFHGIDQCRQPAPVEALRPTDLKPRCLKLSSHGHRISPEPDQPGDRRGVPATMPQRKCGPCDLLHRSPVRTVVMVQNGSRNVPVDVGPAARYRNRLRLDRNRRCRRIDRTRIPHLGLRTRRKPPPHLSVGPAREKVQPVSRFSPRRC